MKTNIIPVAFYSFLSLATAAPRNGWRNNVEDNEECAKIHTEAMLRCLTEYNQIPGLLSLECNEPNFQNDCEIGMRQVISVDDKCVTTKCIKNSFGGEICKNGEVPYKDGCYKIGSSNICAGPDDFTPKRILEADIFGNVSCNCIKSQGLVNYDGNCYSESSLTSCSKYGSSQHQLIRFGAENKGECVPNRCNLYEDTGEIMWRRSDCKETKSKTEYINNCFDCKKFDENVMSCDTNLILKDDIVTCGNSLSTNGVFDNCSEQSMTTGECGELAKKPKQKASDKSILKKLCKINQKGAENTGLSC